MDVEDTPPAAVPRLLAGGGLIMAVLLLGLAAKLGPVARLDLRIDRHIAAHDRTAALTALTKAVSIAGEPAIGVALMVALPVILVLLRRRRDALIAFCMMGGGLALAEVVKQLINEHRPPLPLQAAGADLSPSYPSGHTTTAAIIAVTLIVIAATFAGRAIAIVLGIPYALAVAASRVYLGYHYPPDVVGAFLCALAAAFIVTGLAALPAIQPHLRRFLLLSCPSDRGVAQHREVRGPQRISPRTGWRAAQAVIADELLGRVSRQRRRERVGEDRAVVHRYCGQPCAQRRRRLWPELWATVEKLCTTARPGVSHVRKPLCIGIRPCG